MVRVIYPLNKVTRSIYIEMNDFTCRCKQYLHPDQSNVQTAVVTGIVVALVTTIFRVYFINK